MVSPSGLVDATSIQTALDGAGNGDTVLVLPGTYVENIVMPKAQVTLLSAQGPAQTVLHAASSSLPTVLVSSGQQNTTHVSGFTIEGGRNGVRIIDAEPTIQGNVICRNSGTVGGIVCGANSGCWSPHILDNEICDNNAAGSGGAIAVINCVTPVITGNRIHDNHAEEDGGAIWVISDEAGAVISGNTIVQNVAVDHGGALYVSSIAPDGLPLYLEVSFNIIARNDAYRQSLLDFAGGSCWLANTSAWIHHNTIVENTGNGYGNAIAILRSGSPLIEKNVMASNQNGDGVWCSETATPDARDNLVWAASWGNGGGTCADWFESNGNVVADPRLCSPGTDDYSLSSDSPALNHPSGPLGAVPDPGCSLSPTERCTWGSLKARFAR